MKSIYFLLFILIIVFTGCSSTYTLKDFSSKEKFYGDFNNFAKNKKLTVTLANDSSFITSEGTKISNDSLILSNQVENIKKVILPLSEIKSINDYYDASSNHSVKIFLKDGRIFDEKIIEYLQDSSIEITKKNPIIISKSFPLSRVRKVSYNKRWLGIPFGFISGALIGTIAGAAGIIPVYESHPNMTGGQTQTIETGGAMIVGFGSGTIIGVIAGWLIGYRYNYCFYP